MANRHAIDWTCWPNLAEGETHTVKVYRDHPTWDTCSRWFFMPSHLLRDLFVAAYDCESPAQLEWVYDNHPGCVYIW